MREIKFRAWDREYKVMGVVETLYLHNKELTAEIVDTEEYFECEWKDCELMQYTGLKDKNGVEIYEGDILKCKTSIGYVVYGGIYKDECLNYQYKRCDYHIDWVTNPEGFNDYLCVRSEEVEVIGNIYENPELLKDKR